MRKDQVRIGEVYIAKVNGMLTQVRISFSQKALGSSAGGWLAYTETEKPVHIRTAARLRYRVED